MKKNELFGLKNMFPSNNIASVGVKISCPHTEGVFYCSSYTTQTQTRAVYIILFQYCQSQLDEVKVGFDLYCCAELSEKKLLSWLDKYGQTESRVFYPRMTLYVINRHDPGSVNLIEPISCMEINPIPKISLWRVHFGCCTAW